MQKQAPKCLWIIMILSLGLLLGWGLSANATPAQAHAIVIRAIPDFDAELTQLPARLEMWFSEPLEPDVNQVRLLTSAGKVVPLGSPSLDPADATHLTVPLESLPPEIYTVAFKTLSQADGHTWAGSFPFTVLNPDGSRPERSPVTVAAEGSDSIPSPGQTLARWMALLGGTLLFGVPLFRLLIVPNGAGVELLQTQVQNLALRTVWVAVPAIILGDWLQILIQTLGLGGLEHLPSLLLGTRTNALLLTREILALSVLLISLNLPQSWPLGTSKRSLFVHLVAGSVGIILVFLLTTMQTGASRLLTIGVPAGFGLVGATLALRRSPDSIVERRLWQALLLVGAILLLTFSGSSHAEAVVRNMWAVPVDYVHLLAAATWVGGLLMLAILTMQIWSIADGRAQLPGLVRRFSYLAGSAVLLLIITGLLSSLVQFPTWLALIQTPYGRVLLVKLSLVSLALLAALLNNRLVHGRVDAENSVGSIRFKRQVILEVVFCLGIMVSVAVLTQTASPRDFILKTRATQPVKAFHQVVRADDLNVYLQVNPNQVGRNTFLVSLYNDDRSAIGQVQMVRLIFNYQDEQLGQTKTDLTPLSKSDYTATGSYLNQSGNWDISVYVRRRGMDDLLTKFNLEIGEAAQVNLPRLGGSDDELENSSP